LFITAENAEIAEEERAKFNISSCKNQSRLPKSQKIKIDVLVKSRHPVETGVQRNFE